MLTTVSHSSPRARAFHAGRISSMRILGPSSTALNKSRHRQQSRGFRFGMWSSHLDPEFHREIRRRTRAMKYKYMESLNRKLSWDQHPLVADPKASIRRVVAQYWYSGGRGGRYINVDKVKSWSDEHARTRPERNIENVERSAINRFFQGNGTTAYEYDTWHTPLQNIRNYLARATPLDFSSESKVSKQTKEAVKEKEYEIDPITNRKVQSTRKLEFDFVIPVRPLKSYRSNPKAAEAVKTGERAAAIHSDGPPPAAELYKYNHIKIDTTPWDGGDKPDPSYRSGQPSGPQPYADLDSYKSVTHNEANIEGIEESKYDDLSKYRPIEFTESPTVNEPTPAYSDLDKYRPTTQDKGVTSQDSTPQYEDLDKYGPIMHKEDTQDPATISKYSDLGKYGPVMYKESVSTEDPISQYDDLHKYGPVRWNEPDGLAPLNPEELSKQYTDLAKYGPVQWNEPDGFASIHPEAASKEYTDLKKYGAFAYNEPHGIPPQELNSTSRESEMRSYEPYQYNEPAGLAPQKAEISNNDAEMRMYQAYRYNEPDGQPAEHIDQVVSSLNEFDSKAARLEAAQPTPSWIGKINSFLSNLSEQERAEDLDLLRASDLRARINPRSSSVEKNNIETVSSPRKILEEDKTRYETDWDAASNEARFAVQQSRAKSGELPSTQTPLTGSFTNSVSEDVSLSRTALLQSKANISSVDAENVQHAENKDQSTEKDEVEFASFDESFPKLEPAMSRHTSFTAMNTRLTRMRTQMDPYSTVPQGLELSYARECGGKPTLPTFVRTYGTIAATAYESAEATQSSTEDSKVEQKRRDRNLVSEIRSIYEDTYGKIDAKHRPATVSASSASTEGVIPQLGEQSVKSVEAEPAEPTLYKVLAYDSTMQAINTAETTSIVADSATPLTPAEVLLRLSNPAKFFPHFAPLQAQGYEIVSGSGDVLVFRKVRRAEEIQNKPVAATAAPTRAAPRVNPIDMMGSRPVLPSTGNFASPTGFVNYNYPGAEAEDKPPPPFRSMIDVRREEPVFSGQKSEQRRPKKRRFGKRMIIGAAWVAGISYALGVVGEFFATGGVDGLGPKGL